MLMRRQRLFEACPFLARPLRPAPQPACIAQHSKHTGRADGYDVAVDHHVSQPPVAFQWVQLLEVQDGLFFLVLQPEIPGNPAVMLIDLAVALLPIVKLAHAQLQPFQQSLDRKASLLRPAPDEIHYCIADIRLDQEHDGERRIVASWPGLLAEVHVRRQMTFLTVVGTELPEVERLLASGKGTPEERGST